MKQFKLTTIIGALLFTGLSAMAQEEKVPQPDFINMPAYYIKGTSELKNFGKENIVMAGKMSGGYYELEGPASLVRIKSLDPFVIVVKAGEGDPSNGLFLYKLEANKKKRKAVMAKVSMSGKMDMSKDQVPYTLVKVADKIYKIMPDKPLEVGEYMFMVGVTAYTFGVE